MAIEHALARAARTVLASMAVGEVAVDSPECRDLASLLEAFLPALLREVHAEWKYEGLDGVLPERIRKTSKNELEVVGLCILISDQTLTPVRVRFRVARDADEIDWLDAYVGERGPNGLIRIPYRWRGKGKLAVADRVDDIDWVCHVGLG